jgi:hypothetical protein
VFTFEGRNKCREPQFCTVTGFQWFGKSKVASGPCPRVTLPTLLLCKERPGRVRCHACITANSSQAAMSPGCAVRVKAVQQQWRHEGKNF